MIHICKYCGKEFKDSHKRIYCSKECYDKAQTKQITLKCDNCCKEYKTSPSKAKCKRHFCCNKCRLFWLSIHVKNNVNIKGHSKGHKAPHLTAFNLVCGSFEDNGTRYKEISGKREHRLIIEKIIGRKLRSDEIVHHIDGNKLNNSPNNLMIVTKSEHAKIHAEMKRQALKRNDE